MVEMTFKDAELKKYNASDLQKHFKKFYDSTFGDEKV